MHLVITDPVHPWQGDNDDIISHGRLYDVFTVELAQVYGPFHVGVASRLATAIYVAMVTPILYDNSFSLNDSHLKYESYWPYG